MTLIVSPLENLLKRDYDADTMKMLRLMQKNANRIINLMNQLLDMRKIEKGQLNIHCVETDMVDYIPYVIEPSLGVERSVLAVLCDAYDEEVVGQDKKGNDDVRGVLHLHPALAPFKAAILPLSKKDVLAGPAMELYNELSKEFMVDYDETGSIGKRYRREDEIGTPYCITFDFDTVGDEANGIAADHCVTIRERDSMEQVRIPIDQVKDFLREKCAF